MPSALNSASEPSVRICFNSAVPRALGFASDVPGAFEGFAAVEFEPGGVGLAAGAFESKCGITGASVVGGPIEMTRFAATFAAVGWVFVDSGVSQSESMSLLSTSAGGDEALPPRPCGFAPNSVDFGRSSP